MRDHLVTCGHLHTSGYQLLRDPHSGLISHALRVGSYKTYDRYAVEKGLLAQHVFVCPVTIIDPAYAEDDPRFITVLFDPEAAADFLTWKRTRHQRLVVPESRHDPRPVPRARRRPARRRQAD